MLKYKILTKLFAEFMLTCCVYADTIQAEVLFVMSACDAVQMYLTFHICKLNKTFSANYPSKNTCLKMATLGGQNMEDTTLFIIQYIYTCWSSASQ